jgi:transcription factor SPN1
MNDSDKSRIVTDLLAKMDAAARKDDLLFEQKQPALMKLHMLSTVTSIVSIRAIQHTLLEYDILAVLKDWIAPKDANTLPSLTVRTAIYDILNKLPIGTEHLKRAAPGKQPIGTTIVALRKHKMETKENKLKLKDLMEKWCRPVFSKSIDPRSAVQQSSELRQVSVNRLEAKERVR